MPVIIISQSNNQNANQAVGNGKGNVAVGVWQSIVQIAKNFAIA
jgi:hypothetical protein